MCDVCVMNAVKDRMLSRRSFFKAGAAMAAGTALGTAATTPAMAMGHGEVVDMTHIYDAEFPTYFGAPGIEATQAFNFKDTVSIFSI